MLAMFAGVQHHQRSLQAIQFVAAGERQEIFVRISMVCKTRNGFGENNIGLY